MWHNRQLRVFRVHSEDTFGAFWPLWAEPKARCETGLRAREFSHKMRVENHTLTTRKPTARSRITNGADILPAIDGRSIFARRYRDIAAAIVSDQGGLDRLSEARLQLVRRFAAAACIAEELEARIARGEEMPDNIIEKHSTLCSTLCRLSMRIGLGRRAKDITPTLASYLDIDEEEE